MKTKLFTLLLAVAASVGTILASDIQVDGIWYDFDNRTKTASVTYRGSKYSSYSNEYSGDVVIPSSVIYNNAETYNVISIDDYAFRECTGLTSVTIPNSVTSIGNGAFRDCRGLTSPVYNAHVFAYMPTSCSGAYTIPEGIESIAGSAFYYCSGLTSITIPNSITSIEWGAFAYCTGLTSITIPNSVTHIGFEVFRGCSSLTSVTVGNGVTYIAGRTFAACGSLNSIIVESGNTIYDSRNNCNAIIETTSNTLVAGCANSTIPNSVTSIEKNAFYECTSLTSVTIPNSVTSIGQSAFAYCSNLTSITIPNGVTDIEDRTFECCSGLTSVIISNKVTSIGSRAFAECTGLTSLTCEAMTPPTCDYAFDYVSKSIPLYVPSGSEDAYRKARAWRDFTNIQPIKADNVDITTTEVVPDETSVNIAWPKVSGAASYELVIKDKNGQVVCTLVFDAEGRLLSIAFNAPARDNMPQQTHVAGFAFTVTGLNSGTTYNYSIVAKNSNGNTLNTESGSFKTTGEGSGLQNVTHQPADTKFIRNGQLFILREGKSYTAQGQEVR